MWHVLFGSDRFSNLGGDVMTNKQTNKQTNKHTHTHTHTHTHIYIYIYYFIYLDKGNLWDFWIVTNISHIW